MILFVKNSKTITKLFSSRNFLQFYNREVDRFWNPREQLVMGWDSPEATLYNDILRIARNLLETRENIKIESHSFYHIICDWFSWGSSKKNFFLKKKSKMANFQNRQFSNFFVKIRWIGPWVRRIDWCEGHWCNSTYMVVRLSDIRAKTA